MARNDLFAIGIPTINRWDLLANAIEKYIFDFQSTRIFIVDNGCQGISKNIHNVSVLEPREALSVAKSWNKLCEHIFYIGCSYALILNDDIELGGRESDIMQLITSNEEADFIVNTQNWSSFILPATTFYQKVGPFDPEFKGAYYEDNDYSYRLDMAGAVRVQSPVLDPKVFRESMSAAKDKSLLSYYQHNQDYFIKKWGGLPGQEKYRTPFNH